MSIRSEEVGKGTESYHDASTFCIHEVEWMWFMTEKLLTEQSGEQVSTNDAV